GFRMSCANRPSNRASRSRFSATIDGAGSGLAVLPNKLSIATLHLTKLRLLTPQESSGRGWLAASRRSALEELARAHRQQQLSIPLREMRWLDSLRKDAEALPEDEQELMMEMLASPVSASFLPTE